MTQSEALDLSEDLKDLRALRTNRIFLHHFLPEIERLRAEHRTGMRDRNTPPAERCEHVTGYDDATTLLEFLDKKEKEISRALQEHDKNSPILDRNFLHL